MFVMNRKLLTLVSKLCPKGTPKGTIGNRSCPLSSLVQTVDQPSNLKSCSELIEKPNTELSDVFHNEVKYQSPVFNIAAFADESPTIQELVKLGVDLSKIEKTKGARELILSLDFERDVKKYIRFLHDVGVPADQLGNFITKNPFIFKHQLENLGIRINYLESKSFTTDDISRILTQNPKWMLYSTVEIDSRLGFFQQMFSLDGYEVRLITTKLPSLITFNLQHIEGVKFSIEQEMGFSKVESKQLLVSVPKLYMKQRKMLTSRFQLFHNEMCISHQQILLQPRVLLSREVRTKERHLFLKSLGRNQYDPTKPGYISIMDLVAHDDTQFCSEVAKTPIDLYNRFLKTL